MGIRALFGRGGEGEERSVQSWWNQAGAPGLISASAYYAAPTIDQALRNAATWACIDVLADSIARTPYDVVIVEGGVRRPVPVTPRLMSNPSSVVEFDAWLYQMAWSLLTDGNAFGQITARDINGRPLGIEWLDPTKVTERGVENGAKYVKVNQEKQGVWPAGDIFHVPGRMIAPGSPFSLSPALYAQAAIGTSLSVERYTNQFFSDGAHPTAIISANIDGLTKDQAQAIKDSFLRATSGTRDPAVFGNDLTYTPIQTEPHQTQFIELQRFAVEQACRFWRVPPSMVYASISGQGVTYANVTNVDLHYLKHSLDGYFVRVERAFSSALPTKQVVRAQRDAILRSDPAGRYALYQIALDSKIRSVDEVRALEDLPPWGGEYGTPGIPGAPGPTDPPAPPAAP